jgi:hypothetical protein
LFGAVVRVVHINPLIDLTSNGALSGDNVGLLDDFPFALNLSRGLEYAIAHVAVQTVEDPEGGKNTGYKPYGERKKLHR